MAAAGISLHKVRHFHKTLASSALEWLLIFLLFIHAIFSYWITKFARYCNLQVPCLLCSRLDHILGSEKNGFYWDLICRHHKQEISSLVVCHVHNNLVDVHGICENCLFSFSTINTSNAEKYKLLVSKLGKDPPMGLYEDPFEDHKHGNNSNKICSCCNEPYILRNYVQNFASSRSDFDNSEKRNEPTGKFSDFDYSSIVEYSKVKNTSDTESEVPFSDDDVGISIFRESAELRDLIVQSVPMVPQDLISQKLININSTSELSLLDSQGQIGNNDLEGSKHVLTTVAFGNGLEEISWLQVEPKISAFVAATNSEFSNEVPQASDVNVTQVEESKVCVDGTGTDELEQISSKMVTYEEIMPAIEREKSSEILNAEIDRVMETVLEQRSIEKITVEETEPVIEREASQEIPSAVIDKVMEKVNLKEISIEKVNSEEIKLIAECEVCPETPFVVNDKITEAIEPEQTISEKMAHEELKPVMESDKVTEPVDSEQISSEKIIHEETNPVVERGLSSEIPSVVNDSITQLYNNLDLADAYKLAVGNNRKILSGKLLEKKSPKESSRTSDDLKLLLSKLSENISPRLSGNISPSFFGNISPRLSGTIEEMRTDNSTVVVMPILEKRTSLERNESGFSLDGSFIGEIEGESEIDWLKRQVEHDKKMMGILYKELEEERNASAISANQAMAMITRLQEEKASLQMEASQCVRMMEEQAEYDVEALQNANDLLSEKEKEIQDLEADLEYFKYKLENISMLEGEMESSCGLDKPHAFGKNDLKYNFEDERLFVLESLRKLEKKLHLFSYDGSKCEEGTQELNSKKDENGYSRASIMPDAVAIGEEVSFLIKKLEYFEADRNGFTNE